MVVVTLKLGHRGSMTFAGDPAAVLLPEPAAAA